MSKFIDYLNGKSRAFNCCSRLNESEDFSKQIESYRQKFTQFKQELESLLSLVTREKPVFKDDIDRSVYDISSYLYSLDKKLQVITIEKGSTVQPESKYDLQNIIKSTIKEQGLDCDLNFIDTSKITDMSKLFKSSRFNGDISKWDVSNVTNMEGMFAFSSFNGDISKWNTSNVFNMSNMFAYTDFNGDISKWNTSKVQDMRSMFQSSQFNGDISKWKTSKVTCMSAMFAYSIFNKDISKWNVSNVKDMRGMFLESEFSGDISKWTPKKLKYVEGMFYHTKLNVESIISKWETPKVESWRNLTGEIDTSLFSL